MNEIRVPVEGGELAVFVRGQGEPVIFLHGGPGDTHHYMKRMAEPLFSRFQCIYFDQRGTGESFRFVRSKENFRIELLLEDINRVRLHFSKDPVRLVGHSWGAMYGLYACMQTPERYSHAALLNMGPLDSQMERLCGERLLSAMGPQDHEMWRELRLKRNRARDNGELSVVGACDREMMKLRVKSWIFDPALREAYLNDYFQDPPPDREVNKLIWEGQSEWFKWENVSRASTKIWLLAGEHDATPIEQFQRLNALLPFCQLTTFAHCGHIPWFEVPALFEPRLAQSLE